MITFKEYIEWVKKTQLQLATAWVEAVKEVPGDPELTYSRLGKGILGTFEAIHPKTDNGRFYVNMDLDNSLELLIGVGWKITDYVENKSFRSAGKKRKTHTSDYYRLIHSNGVASIQLYEDPVNLVFYVNEEIGLVERFTCPEEAYYKSGIPFERRPDFSFGVQTLWPINPYGGFKYDARRDTDGEMEETMIQLMDEIIGEDVGASFQNYGDRFCVVNAPMRD